LSKLKLNGLDNIAFSIR